MKLWGRQAVNSSPATTAEVCTTPQLFLMAYKHWHTYSASGDGLFHTKPLYSRVWMILLDILVVHRQQRDLLWKGLKPTSYFSKSHTSHHIKAQKRGTALTTVIQTNSNIQCSPAFIEGIFNVFASLAMGLVCIDQLIPSLMPVPGGAKRTDWPNWLQTAGMSTFTTASASLQFQISLHLGTHRTLLVEGATRSRVQWTLEQAQLWPPAALQRCSSILQVLSKAADRT